MTLRPRHILGWLTALFLLSLVAHGQANPTTGAAGTRGSIVKGQVIDLTTEAPVERLKVELRLAMGDTVQVAYTRQNGEFEFTNVGNGNYVVVIEEKGYEPVRETVDMGSAQRQGFTLYLRKLTVGREEDKGNSVSVHELALSRRTRDTFRKGLEELYKDRDFRESMVHLQRTLSEAPNFYEAHYHLGIAMMHLGRDAEAEQELRKCLEFVGDDPFSGPYFALASLLSSRNEFAEAEALARQGLTRDPDPWQGHYELARALLEMNRTNEAEKSVAEAIKRKPDYAPAYLMRANINIRKKNYGALIRDLDEYLRLEPDGPMSASARQTREQIQKMLARNIPDSPPVAPPPDPPE